MREGLILGLRWLLGVPGEDGSGVARCTVRAWETELQAVVWVDGVSDWE